MNQKTGYLSKHIQRKGQEHNVQVRKAPIGHAGALWLSENFTNGN